MNYESELDELLFSKLQETYGIKKKDLTYRYFLVRFHIENYPHILTSKMELVDFLLNELGIIDPVYKGVKLTKHIATENSLTNILDNWHFRYMDFNHTDIAGNKIDGNTALQNELKEIFAKAEKRTNRKKTDPSYLIFFKKNCLDLLKDKYGITPTPVTNIEGFQVNPFLPTLEEKYERLIHAKTYFSSISDMPSEEELEKYVARNLHLIETGMKLLGTQYEVEGGRVDILAEDKYGNICVVELKVTNNDPVLIWQSMYYPIAVQKEFKNKKIRMITLTPKLAEHIYIPLKQIKGIEMFIYKARMSCKTIESLDIIKKSINSVANQGVMAY